MANIIIGVLILLALCIIVSAGWKYITSWVWVVFLCVPGVIFFIPAMDPATAGTGVAVLSRIVGLVMLLVGIILTGCAMDDKREREDRERLDRENAMLLNAFLKEKGAFFLNNVLAEDTTERKEEVKEEAQETTNTTDGDNLSTPMDKLAEKAESCLSRAKFKEMLNKYGTAEGDIFLLVTLLAVLCLVAALCHWFI